MPYLVTILSVKKFALFVFAHSTVENKKDLLFSLCLYFLHDEKTLSLDPYFHGSYEN